MPEQLKSFTKRIRSDGSGDIVFTGTLPMVNRNSGNIALVQNGFYAVANVKEAEGALLKLAGNS